jgi:hypothetical protein
MKWFNLKLNLILTDKDRATQLRKELEEVLIKHHIHPNLINFYVSDYDESKEWQPLDKRA